LEFRERIFIWNRDLEAAIIVVANDDFLPLQVFC